MERPEAALFWSQMDNGATLWLYEGLIAGAASQRLSLKEADPPGPLLFGIWNGLILESKFALMGVAMAAMQVSIECEGSDIFVVADGVKIAKLGHPGTPQANTWVSLEPGWTVRACDDGDAIEVEYKRQRMH